MLSYYNGHEITYDEIGNPLSYYNGSSYEFSWDGRELYYAEKDGDSYYFNYNDTGIRTSKTKNGVKTTYYVSGSQIAAEKTNGNITVYIYDAEGLPLGMRYHGADYAEDVWDVYWYERNLFGDIVAVYDEAGTKLISYEYDAFGKCFEAYYNGGNSTSAVNNPFRYRGYFYDTDLEFYYVCSRYYDPQICRWINADNQIAGVGGEILGYNMFAYCFNNPVNMYDPTGNWPKWLSGVFNMVDGSLKIVAGTTLGATAGWTGFGAGVATFLIADGAATVVQGVGQIVNSAAKTDVMREDNIVRTGVQKIGQAIGGETGAKIAGITYDATVFAATLHAGKVALQQSGKLPVKANIDSVINNPLDEFVTVGPADGVIQRYCRTIPQSGYGKIYVTPLGNGLYQIVNGHHRVAALRTLGYKTIKIFLTK